MKSIVSCFPFQSMAFPPGLIVCFLLLAHTSTQAQTIHIDRAKVLVLDPVSREIHWESDQFRWPMGVKALSNDHYLVCDYQSRRVAEVDSKGNIVWEVPGNNPDDVQRLETGETLVVNNGNSEIVLYRPDKTEVFRITEGLDHPSAAAFSLDGQIVVTDSSTGRLLRFDRAGGLLGERGGFKKPTGLRRSAKGYWLVTDLDAHLIAALDDQENVLWERSGFLHPMDVAEKPDAGLVVADSGNRRVVELAPDGSVIREVLFDQWPTSIDLLPNQTWLLSFTYQVPEDPPPAVPAPLSMEPGATLEPRSASPTRDGQFRLWDFAPYLLVALLALLLILFTRSLSTRSSRGAQPVINPAFGTKGPRVRPGRRNLLLVLTVLLINGALIFLYNTSGGYDTIRIDCGKTQAQVSLNGRDVGRVNLSSLPEDGFIGFTLWEETSNNQFLKEVVITDPSDNRILYEARFDGPSIPEGFRQEGADWSHVVGKGITNIGKIHRNLRLTHRTFGVCRIQATFENAAEFAVLLRSDQTNSEARIFMRPQRHMDAWAEVVNRGNRNAQDSSSLNHLDLSFYRQVQLLGNLLLKSYFFAWALVAFGGAAFVGLFFLVLCLDRLTRGAVGEAAKALLSMTTIQTLRRATAAVTAVLVLIGALYVFQAAVHVASVILEKMPHLQDSVSYLFEAKLLSSGRISTPSPPSPLRRFFDHEFIINNGNRFGLQTPGMAFLLAIGERIQRPWLANPVIAFLTVILLFCCARRFYGSFLAFLCCILVFSSPWVSLMSGTMMPHPASLACALLVLWGLSSGGRRGSWWPFFAIGFGLGYLILLHPGTALAVGVPAIAWSFIHIGRVAISESRIRRRVRGWNSIPFSKPGSPAGSRFRRSPTIGLVLRYVIVGTFCLLSIGLVGLFNYHLTGSPFRSTYREYSQHLRMGFGPDVGVEWGTGHDRVKAMNNLRANLNEFYRYWKPQPNGSESNLESFISTWLPIWIFAPLFSVIILMDKKAENVLSLCVILGTIIAFYCYFNSGISYGPRFYYVLLAPVALLTVRGCWVCADWPARFFQASVFRNHSSIRAFSTAAVTLLLMVPGLLPGTVKEGQRLIQSFRGYNGMNGNTIRMIKDQNLKNAVVIVDGRNSWWTYGNLFWAMSPDLDDDVVFVRDQGVHNVPKPGNTPLDNRLLLDLYPDRTFYKLEGNRLRKLDLRR